MRQEEEEIKREQEEDEEMMKLANGQDDDKNIFKDDFYNRELMHITLDYLDLRESLRTVRN